MLTFYNPGIIDIRGATITGLSAKADETAIGFFGTGLKYSIAVILRMGGSITIFAGLEKYEFTTETLNFRGKEFSQILMNGQPLSFTTEYGKTWLPWQIFRELYANARDEGGSVADHKIEPSEGSTTIHVSCFEIDQEFNKRDQIILPDHMVYDFDNPSIRVSHTPSPAIYYKSVSVLEKPTLFTYNFMKDISLTEDRTVANPWYLKIILAEQIQSFTDETVIEKILNAQKGDFENELTYAPGHWTSHSFIAVAKRLYRQDPSKYKHIQDVIERFAEELTKPVNIVLSPMREKMLTRSIDLVERMGHKPRDVEIIVAPLGNSTLGLYKKGVIFLDPVNFDKGCKQVVSTLLEEVVHHETGKADCCYDMQTYLFDRIVSLYEEHVFEEAI